MQTVWADCERTIEGEVMNAEQEKALREYLQEAIVPLIEQVLVKKLGQAMSFAAEQLIQPKREWQGLTDDEIRQICDENFIMLGDYAVYFIESIQAKLKEKNT
jgi:hypothetical protein